MNYKLSWILITLWVFPIINNCGKSKNLDPIQLSAMEKTTISKKHLLGQYNYKLDGDFVKIDPKYGNKDGMYIQKVVYDSFLKMRTAAAKDGITLIIVSATRNFNEQKTIWEAKWTGAKLVNGENLSVTVKDPIERAKIILKYSSMPGTSRHHWGTDIDINSIDKNYFTTKKGKDVYDWLIKNAGKYGFCQPYNEKNNLRPNGYEEEKWHWSYSSIANQYLTEYIKTITYSDINGFLGSETASNIDIFNKYVLGINQQCINF